MSTVIQNLKKQAFKNVTRFCAAAILLFWIGQALPLLITMAAAADDACHLSCCSGLAPHSAGSCAGGICHLKPAKKLPPRDIMCGAKAFAKKASAAKTNKLLFIKQSAESVPVFDETQTVDSGKISNLPFVQIKIAEQFCQTICGISASQTSGQQNNGADEKNAAPISFALQPRPPTAANIEFQISAKIKLSQIIARRSPARAPPSDFFL